MKGSVALFAEEPVGVFIDAADALTLVAEVEDVIVGYASVRFVIDDRGRVARLVRVYVRPEARRIGIGDALVAAVVGYARERGCASLDTLALPGDRDTKNLYERNGITARLIVASTDLS